MAIIDSIITWLLIIVGWVIINKQHNTREERKEIRSEIDRCYDLLEKLEDCAVEYHTSVGRDEELARQIKGLLDRVSSSVRHIKISPVTEYNHKLIALRKAITLINFDTVSHCQQPIKGDFIDRIALSVLDIMNFLEDKFSARYR